MQEQGGDFPLTPLQGTYVIGACNGITASMALLIITKFGRRPIFITGQFAMACFMFLTGLSVLNEWNMSSFIMINLFITGFQFSQGSVAWLYVPEVCVDSATGLAVAGQFINLTIISFTFEYMINSALKVHGSLWYFAGLCLLGFIFCLLFVKETRGLTDFQKKTLYSPSGAAEIEKVTHQIQLQQTAFDDATVTPNEPKIVL